MDLDMSFGACFVCNDVSPGSLPALETVCMPSGKSVAEQLCKGLGGCLLPLLPEHVACISCQQTIIHLDQLWAQAELLQRDLSDKFLRACNQVNTSTIQCYDIPPATAISPTTYPLSPEDADDCGSSVSEPPTEKGTHPTSEDTPCATSLADHPCPSTESTLSPLPEGAPCPSDSSAGAAAEDIHHPGEEVVGSSASPPPETVPVPAPRRAGRVVRTGPKTCPHCGRSYKRWRDLDTHLSVHTGSRPHQCAQCGRQFASRRRLTDHQRGHAEGWTCQVCSKVFRHPSSLQHHRRLHEKPAAPSVCPVCSRSVSGPAQLRAHLRTHTGERPFQCASCPRAFRQASTLRVHARLHSGAQPFTCDTCGKGFRGRAAFMSHLQQHGAVAARFACDTCGKTFFYRSKMEQHRATHGGEKTACCELCGVTFSSVVSLKRHQVTHSTQRPHGCGVCGRRFKEAGVLRKHQRQMHSADAGHVCTVCSKRCAGPYKLREHMRTHTGERPFACALCPKAFTQAVHLNMHQRAHQRPDAAPGFTAV